MNKLRRSRVALMFLIGSLAISPLTASAAEPMIKPTLPSIPSVPIILIDPDDDFPAGSLANAPLIERRWEFSQLKGAYYAPSLAADGTLYVGSWNKYSDGDGLTAIAPNGKLLWSLLSDNGYYDTTIGPDGTLYAARGGGGLQQIFKDGRVGWTYSGLITGKISFLPDGTIVLAVSDNIVWIDPDDGSVIRSVDVPSVLPHSLSVAADGTVYAVSGKSSLYSVKPDGSLKWSRDMTGGSGSSYANFFGTALGSDGTVYAVANKNTVVAYKPDGSVKDQYTASADISTTPVIGKAGELYVGLVNGKLIGLNTAMDVKWITKFTNSITRIVAGPGELAYVYSSDGQYLYAIAAVDGNAKWKAEVPHNSGGGHGNIVFSSDGTLFASGFGLFALGTPPVASVTLDKPAIELQAGQSTALTATVAPSVAVNRKVNWKSDNPNVAHVNGSGIVTAVSAGKTKVIASTDEGGYMAISEVNVSASPPPLPVLTDIEGHWAKPEITKAVELGIVFGYEDGTFKPEKGVTRAEFAVMLMRALKPDVEGITLPFTDQNDIPSWAAKAVAQAAQLNIVRGNSDGTFLPSNHITHEEMLAMVVRASGITAPDPAPASGYADDADLSDWARGSAYIASRHSLLGGMNDNKVRPKTSTTRAESAAAIVRMLDL
ncbi:S-layer homology domain-containing protein [Paenibacillus sp. GCM10012303]|uniref:S-layer homology domain-containing protein n=1 Tax=Paenibacillus sp. GCM10012303 TaxID=3317340 RepID=UPI0036109165